MKNYKFKFSVIIPVYNVEDYLEETIESVLNQTLDFKDNIQIVLVNDGSPDNSGKICERYHNLYPDNIKYVIKENGGVSSARNLGLEHAEGEFINFLDSDDKWGYLVFEEVNKFFEEHDGEIDVVCTRMRIFDARSAWHVLDYKFNNGTRVVDITDEEEQDSIQLHVSSAFIKREAIADERFNEKVKFGEDALFINSIILKKLRYGLIKDFLYYYRKRPDQSSATQTQKFNEEFYTISPQLYYRGVIDLSEKYCGEIIPYIQNILAYDIGWRVGAVPPDEIVGNEELYGQYCAFLQEMLSYVDERILLCSKTHKNIAKKIALIKLRNGKDLLAETTFDPEEKIIRYKDIDLLIPKNNHGCCAINYCCIEKNKLVIEGLLAKWVLECCGDSEIKFILRVGKKDYPLELSEYPFIKQSNFYGIEQRNLLFKKEINLKHFFKKKDDVKIRLVLSIDDVKCNLSIKYGKFVPNAIKFKPMYNVFGKYVMIPRKSHISIYKPENIRKEKIEREKECQKWLRENELGHIASFRCKCILFKKFLFRSRKIWLVSDRFDKANDNGEVFFRYLCKATKNTPIVPVFAISKYSEDAKRLSKIGKVVYFEDEEKYKKYFLCADKIITSSGGEFATNPLDSTERIYLTDLIKSELVFLQHGIIYNDLSSWLQKYNKNIKLFVTSAEKEYESIVNGNYFYSEKEVLLSGLARYDKLESKTEKLIVVLPTWRRSIKESYNNRSESVYFPDFVSTEYFRFYNSLINDERLLSAMRKKGYKGLFCLHPIHAKQSVDYTENDVFRINEGFIDYAKIFSEAAMMITDYSSVFFDFAYLRKPLVYTQFDKEEFYEEANFEEGYWDWENDGFGPVCNDIDSAVSAIISAIDRNCENEQKYLERIDSFYAFRDRNNCKRIFEAIKNMG